jgi:hypothetical protein
VARAGVARQRMYSRRGLGPQPRDLGVRPPGAPRAGQEQRPYVPCSWERGPTFCNSARAQLDCVRCPIGRCDGARAYINHPAAPGHLSVLARAERARSITAVFFSPGAWCHSASRLVRGRPPWIGSPRCSTTRWAETPSVDKLLRGAGQGALAMGAADQVRWRGAVRQKPTGRARAERRRALRAIAARGTAWGTAWAPAACLPLPS